MSAPRPSVLITGGAQRLGLVLAAQCLEMGYDTILHYRSSKSAADRWMARHPRLRARVSFLRAELTDPSRDIVAEALAIRPGLCGLINNASVFSPGAVTDLAHLRSLLDVNALTPLRLGEAFRAQVKRGWIVNITDAHIRGSILSFQNYRLSKRLLQDLTGQMALAYAPRIRVNAIAPGAMMPAKIQTRLHFREIAREIPLRRTGDLASLRQALAYLITNEYVTGQTLFVDGGWHLR